VRKYGWWRWLIPVLLVAAWVGARGLNADALWFDEYWSVYNAGGAHYGPLSPADIWTRVATQDPWQAPGYFLLLSGWGALAGWSPFALRGLSLLAGLLAVAWAYRLGRDLVSPLGGQAAAVTMGLSAYFLYYFHEMRTYTLIVMLIATTGWAYWRVAHGGGRWSKIALFGGALCLLYTHYFAALTMGILGLYHLLFVRKERQWWNAALLIGAAGLLFIPWAGVLINGANSAVEDTLRQSNAWTPRQAISGALFMYSNGAALLAVVVGAYSLIPLSTTRDDDRRNIQLSAPPNNRPTGIRFYQSSTFFSWFWLLGMLALLLAVNARFGVILEVRYLFPLWPPLALVAALGIDRMARNGARPAAYLILGLWAAAGVWNSVDSEARNTLRNPHWYQPWDVFVEQLRPHLQDGDALLYLLPDWTWPSYHQSVFEYYLYGLPNRHTLLQRPENVGIETFQQQATEAVDGAERVWLAYTANQPTSYIETADQILKAQGYLDCGGIYQTDQLHLGLYTHQSAAPIRFGEQVTNTLLTADYIPGQLTVAGIWSPDPDVVPNTYSVGIHIKNAAGELVAQSDYGLPAVKNCVLTILDLSALPVGDYTVETVVYDWQTGERLRARRTGGSAEGRESQFVGTFSVLHD
jgi:hypothetical protein